VHVKSSSRCRDAADSTERTATQRPAYACRDVKPGYSASSTDEDVSLFFRPQKVGAYEVPNRLVYAPLTRCRAIDSNPQKNMVEYYRQRGAGSEGGLVIAEGTVISDTGFG